MESHNLVNGFATNPDHDSIVISALIFLGTGCSSIVPNAMCLIQPSDPHCHVCPQALLIPPDQNPNYILKQIMDSPNLHNATDSLNGNANETNQGEIVTYMEPRVYKAAVNGVIDRFHHCSGPDLTSLLTPNKNTLLHIFISSQKPKSESPIAFVQLVLDKCPSLLIQPNIKGETPLHLASRLGLVEIVKVLINRAKTTQGDIESGVEAARAMIRRASLDKDTALHEAVRYNHVGVVRILTREDPDFVYSVNDEEETPLFLAVEREYDDIAKEILETCTSPSFNGPFGRSALHAATINQNLEMTRKILERNLNLAKGVDQQGWTPLHHASHLGSLAIVKLLLHSDKSAAYVRDHDEKKTPLHIAALCGFTHKLIAKTIISHCPDSCEIVDEKGRNALHYAVQSRSLIGIRLLLQNPFISNLINQKDEDGKTPIHYLASLGVLSISLLSHPFADKMAVTKQHLTPVDVLLDSGGIGNPYGVRGQILTRLKKSGSKQSRRDKINIKLTPSGMVKRGVSLNELNKAKDAHLITATLVATVTFAAGFTIPGGYNSDKGVDQGIAILTRKTAFQTFLISDTLALVFSTTAVLIQFLLAMQGNDKFYGGLLQWKPRLILIAMGLMVVAFTAGTYAVLPHPSGLGDVILVITGCYFLLSFILVVTLMPLFVYWGKTDK